MLRLLWLWLVGGFLVGYVARSVYRRREDIYSAWRRRFYCPKKRHRINPTPQSTSAFLWHYCKDCDRPVRMERR
jgi:hypothetical protein